MTHINLTRKCIAEAIGTFGLVFAGTGAIIINDISGGVVTHVGIAITFGLAVMTMIYAVGETSGAHINPAVTIGFWLARRLPGNHVGPYVASQIAGAFIASALLYVIFHGQHGTLGTTLPAGPEMQSFFLEIALTAILVFVILCVATGSKEIGVMAGIAIGGVVGMEAMFAGPISGASMNPARSLAPAIVSGTYQSLWVYLVAPVIGGAIAVPCWMAIRKPSRQLQREVETMQRADHPQHRSPC